MTATTLMRLADAPVLPFEFGAFSSTVKTYVTEIKKLSGDKVNFQPILSELTENRHRLHGLRDRPQGRCGTLRHTPS